MFHFLFQTMTGQHSPLDTSSPESLLIKTVLNSPEQYETLMQQKR